MNPQNIKAGDLVVVIKPSPCCNNTNLYGEHYIVKKIVNLVIGYCNHCRKMTVCDAALVDSRHKEMGIYLSMLKKINPLDELDDIELKMIKKTPEEMGF